MQTNAFKNITKYFGLQGKKKFVSIGDRVMATGYKL